MSDSHFPDDSQLPEGSDAGAPDGPVPADHPAEIWSSDDEAAAPGSAVGEQESWLDQGEHLEGAVTDADAGDDASHQEGAADEQARDAFGDPLDAAPGDEAAADPFADEGGEAGADPLGDAVGSALAAGELDAAWNSPGAVTGWSGTAVAPEPAVTAWAVGVEDPDPDYIDPNLLDH